MASPAPTRIGSFAIWRRCLSRADLLIFNDTRVIPARVFGEKASGGRVELLLERGPEREHRTGACSRQQGLTRGAPSSDSRRARARACCRGRMNSLCWNFPATSLAFFARHGRDPAAALHRPAGGRQRSGTLPDHIRASGRRSCRAHRRVAFRRVDFRGASSAGKLRTAFVTLHVGAGTFAPGACRGH